LSGGQEEGERQGWDHGCSLSIEQGRDAQRRPRKLVVGGPLQEAVDQLLPDYKGYVVADAHNVYDHLYRNGAVEVDAGADVQRTLDA
jgi:hypothetical protein